MAQSSYTTSRDVTNIIADGVIFAHKARLLGLPEWVCRAPQFCKKTVR